MVEVKSGDFSADDVIKRLKNPNIGGIVIYLGTVRLFSEEKQVEALQFDADEVTIKKRLEEIEGEARHNFAVDDIAIVHRLGTLRVSDNILLIAVSAAHREPAFAACQYIIDNVKVAHASWGKEVLRVA
jgi:molybdopterin synthase catalytic subunit